MASHFSIFDELKNWSKSLKDWQRLALLKILKRGKIDEQDIQSIYEEFKVNNGLTETSADRQNYKIDDSFIPETPQKKDPLLLHKICDVKGVNAIVEGQELYCGPKLTVIYGPNGSGKSGYARIIKAACFTRSPNKAIHGNVNRPMEDRQNPSATFIFSNHPKIDFIDDHPCPELRDNFAVFDSSCIRVHIDEENDFNITIVDVVCNSCNYSGLQCKHSLIRQMTDKAVAR